MPQQDMTLMAHLLRRTGFGATRDDLEAYVAKASVLALTDERQSETMSTGEALEVLGLEPGADEAAIRAARKRLLGLVHPDRGGSAGAGRTDRYWTVGGIVGASVIETCSFPLVQFIVHCPRSAFSTTSNWSGGVQAPALARRSSSSFRRRSFDRSMNRFSAAIRSASASSHCTTSFDTASRAASSAGDGWAARGRRPPVAARRSKAFVMTLVHPVYVRFPNATMPTP